MIDNTHKFPYKWNLKDAVFTKDKGKVLVALLVYWHIILCLWYIKYGRI